MLIASCNRPYCASGMGQRVPTWRVIPGTCRHSLALVVMAQHCGIDSPVVADALRFDQVCACRTHHASLIVVPTIDDVLQMCCDPLRLTCDHMLIASAPKLDAIGFQRIQDTLIGLQYSLMLHV